MLRENLNKINETILEVCNRSGRSASEITLIAVSKNHKVNEIASAYELGVHNFGENRAQELKEKASLLKLDFTWHFIGHLQTNKVKYVMQSAGFIHSIDSVKLAAEVNKHAANLSKRINILLEIKTSSEATKYGLEDENEIIKVAEYCKESGNLNLVGLMTIAPFTDDEKKVRYSFVQLRKLRDSLNYRGFGLNELSMGMTNDYKIAIEEGATMLRIGSAIFGERIY
ncbi:MAG TPA: YggS family pyridoxal phosphate-dependent enzyme [Ignavibacteriaceae bacterium]|jgi:pyridoxal phosphate enzyme (YggS family)|nr:YggS family pyridoxal phosphate-dependent enzyme [Ignavibacteriaceae bacterium]